MARKIAGINLKLWGLKKGSSVLDLGAAKGILTLELAQAGYDVTGIEPVKQLVDDFNTRDKRNIKAKIIHGSAYKLPFKDDSFDGAVATEVLEHIPDTKVVLGELNRVLKPGARVVISVPTDVSENIYYQLYPTYKAQATHVHTFSESRLKKLLGDAGFRVYKTKGENSDYAFLWIGQSILKIPFDFTGTPLYESKWAKFYWKSFKLLQMLHLRGVVTNFGNLIFPKSRYFYAEKI